MIDRLVQYVLESKDDLSQVRLEEAAVCAVYAKTEPGRKDPDRYAELLRTVEAWRVSPRPEPPETFGRRQQLLLRTVIDLLLTRSLERLAREDIAFLCEACDLAFEAAAPSQRLHELLDAQRAPLRRRREELGPPSSLNMLETRVRIVFADELENSPRRQAPLFPGQPRPGPQPTLEATGPLRVIGSIPHDCTLIVTSGPCSVDGYVQGRLGAAGGCDIAHNISGIVVAARGDVRCRNIIEQSFVVAKTGWVRFATAMNPATVFAGEGVVASEAISRGLFYGARIEAATTVRGGVFHVSRLLDAEELAPAEGCPLDIVLRTGISFEEYGERLGQDALHLKARAARLRRHLTHLGNMVRATQAEAEHAASTVVLRAFSQLRFMTVLEDRGRAQRRIAVLNRLIAALQELYSAVEDALSQDESLPEETGGEESFAELMRDLDEIGRDGNADSKTFVEREEARSFYQRVVTVREDKLLLRGLLVQLRERMERWIVERQDLNTELSRLNGEINRAVPEAGLEDVVQNAAERKEPKLAALQRKIMALKNNPPNAEVERKMQAPLVQLMINNMQRRIQRLNELGASIKVCKEELAQVRDELHAKYRLGDKAEVETTPAVAAGRFAAGVRIYRDAYLLNEAKPSPGAVIQTPDSAGKRTAYARGLASVFQTEPPLSRSD